MDSLPHEQAAQILARILESLARQTGKTLSQKTRADILRACELLTQAAGDLGVLDDLPQEPRTSPAERAIDDPQFERWRAERRMEQGGR